MKNSVSNGIINKLHHHHFYILLCVASCQLQWLIISSHRNSPQFANTNRSSQEIERNSGNKFVSLPHFFPCSSCIASVPLDCGTTENEKPFQRSTRSNQIIFAFLHTSTSETHSFHFYCIRFVSLLKFQYRAHCRPHNMARILAPKIYRVPFTILGMPRTTHIILFRFALFTYGTESKQSFG